jgi:hypothetical protein
MTAFHPFRTLRAIGTESLPRATVNVRNGWKAEIRRHVGVLHAAARIEGIN